MKFVEAIKLLLKKIKELWNIYAGLGLSLLLAIISRWSIAKMDLISSYLTLTLVVIGACTYLRYILENKRKNKKFDVVALTSNKRTKQISKAMNPSESGEELGKVIIYTVKEGKVIVKKVGKFFKFLWGNKLTLISIISNLLVGGFATFLTFSEHLLKFEFFQEHQLVFKIVVPILVALWLIDNIFTCVTKYGMESLSELQARSEQAKEKAMNKLTPEQVKMVKETIVSLKEKKDKVVKELEPVLQAIKDANAVIDSFNILKSIGITPNNEQEIEFTQANANLRENSAIKLVKEQVIQHLDDEINGLKNRL